METVRHRDLSGTLFEGGTQAGAPGTPEETSVTGGREATEGEAPAAVVLVLEWRPGVAFQAFLNNTQSSRMFQSGDGRRPRGGL